MKDPFEQSIERYLRRWRPTLRPVTIENKGYILRRFVVYLREQHHDVQRFSQLRRQPHIEDWLEYILYMKAASRNASIRTLRLFLDDMIRWQWTEAPPPGLFSEEDLAPEENYLPRPLPPDIDQAVQKAFIEAGTFAAMALLLLRYTGLRIGEMRALPLHAMEPAGGERDQGKNLMSNVLVSKLVGGHVDASDYLTGQTRFSGKFFAAPLWTMDDVTPLSDSSKHRHYTALLKKMVANRIFSADEKFKKVQTVEWCGRVVVTTNLDPESIRILPALDVSNQDKVCLFRVRTADRQFSRKVAEVITGELPSLGRWLLDWDAPEEVRGSVRYGVKPYIEQSLLVEARQSSDTAQFEELLGAYLQQLPDGTTEWSGTATDLMAQFAGVEGFGVLLRDVTPVKIGRQLAKLESGSYLRFERKARARTWHVDIPKYWSRGDTDVPF